MFERMDKKYNLTHCSYKKDIETWSIYPLLFIVINMNRRDKHG